MTLDINKRASRAGFWYTIGNISIKGIVFLSLPIFTRLLTVSDFGTYNTYIAYEQILVAILGLGLYGTIKNAFLDYDKDFDKYISSIISICLSLLFICVLVVNAWINYAGNFLGYDRLVSNCLFLQSYGSTIINLYGIKLNTEFKYKPYLIIGVINNLGNILFSVLLIKYVFFNKGFLGRIIGSCIPLVALGLTITVITMYNGKTFYNKKFWKYALVLGIPLIPHVLSQSLLNQFDRIMITNMIGNVESGAYSFIYTISTILYVVENSFEHAWSPWVFQKLSNDLYLEVKKTSKKYIEVFVLLTIGFMCVAPEISKCISKPEYWDGIILIFPLSVSMFCIFLYSLPANVEYYYKKTVYISIGTVGAAVLNVILNFFFIKLFGYKAAAYTTVVSYMMLFIFHWYNAKKLGVSQIYQLKDIALSLLIVASLSIFFTITYNTSIFSICIRIIVCCSVIIRLFTFKDAFIKSILMR